MVAWGVEIVMGEEVEGEMEEGEKELADSMGATAQSTGEGPQTRRTPAKIWPTLAR